MKVKYVVLSCAVGLMLCGAAVSWFGYGRQAETLARLNGQRAEVRTEESKASGGNGGREQSGGFGESCQSETGESETEAPKDFIKWVDFDVTVQAMEDAYRQDVDSYGSGQHLNWIELLAYLATKYGGDFARYKTKDMEELVQALRDSGQTMAEYARGREYYPYYLEAYTAVLGGLVGE